MASVDLRERIEGRTRIAVARAGNTLESVLRSTGPVDEGNLVRQTYVRPRGPRRLEITVEVDYASFVREGTAPHPIYPKNKQYLAFEWAAAPPNMGRLPDGRVLARAVNHPGTDPNPWYNEAIDRMPGLIADELVSSPV